MLPLVRPLLPPMPEIERWLAGARATGQWSNFGFAWREAINKLDKYTGKYNALVHNGTSAIELAARHWFKPCCRVVIPDFTHAGTLQAVVRAGMIPILAPVNKSTWTLDFDVLTKNLKEYDALIVVSPFGYYVDFEKYDDFARVNKKRIIYDLAGAWGMPTVATENPCTFSLHATKNFSCGEGGIITLAEESLRERIRASSNFDTLPDRSIASIDGGNYKIDEFKAAIVCAHMDNHQEIEKRISDKKSAISFYENLLGELCAPHELHLHPDAAPSLCVLAGLPANKLEASKQKTRLDCRQYYKLLSSMPELNKVKRIGVSGSYFETCAALPSDCKDYELDWAVEVLRKFIRGD